MKNNNTQAGQDLPYISIIIPAKNEEKDIKRCLESIFQIDYPQNKIEIIVVDNNSTDNTVAFAKEFDDVIVINCCGYVGKVRNEGGKQAKGDILAFLDADCLPPKNWLRRGLEILNSNDDLEVVGACLHLETEAAPWVEKLWINYLSVGHKTDINYVDTISSFCFITTKKIMEKVGWFNETLETCEDSDLGYRISELGYKLCIDKTIKTVHLGNAKTLNAFFKRQLWQGGSNLKNTLTHSFSWKELPSIVIPLVFILQVFITVILFATFNGKLAFISLLLTTVLPTMIVIKKKQLSSIKVAVGYFVLWSTYLFARGLGMFIKAGRWKT